MWYFALYAIKGSVIGESCLDFLRFLYPNHQQPSVDNYTCKHPIFTHQAGEPVGMSLRIAARFGAQAQARLKPNRTTKRRSLDYSRDNRRSDQDAPSRRIHTLPGFNEQVAKEHSAADW